MRHVNEYTRGSLTRWGGRRRRNTRCTYSVSILNALVQSLDPTQYLLLILYIATRGPRRQETLLEDTENTVHLTRHPTVRHFSNSHELRICSAPAATTAPVSRDRPPAPGARLPAADVSRDVRPASSSDAAVAAANALRLPAGAAAGGVRSRSATAQRRVRAPFSPTCYRSSKLLNQLSASFCPAEL